MKRIVVVEDEDVLRTTLAFNLRRDGFDVIEVATGDRALEIIERTSVDLVLLDLMLPGVSGTEVCRKIRESSDVAVIMVTAKDDVVDRVVGLELGADDYVTKPYSYRELLARVRAVLRRQRSSVDQVDDEVLVVGRVQLSVDRHEVRLDGCVIHLPLREFELLELLIRNVNRVVTRQMILAVVWGSDVVDTKTLDVHIKRLRQRLEIDPKNPRMIVTVRGVGYKLVG